MKMKKAIFSALSLTALLLTGGITSCNKSDDLGLDDSADQALYGVQERGGMGKPGCFELVFPVSMVMPDGTTTLEADSWEELREGMRTWIEANGGKKGGKKGGPKGGFNGGQFGGNRPHPSFVFPITVISEEGETITVETQEELQSLRAECGGAYGGFKGGGKGGFSCFEPVFPVTVQFPDGTTSTVQDKQSLRKTMMEWRKNNPGVKERPNLVFPITVKMADDGSTVTVNSKEELIALKKDCKH